VHCAGAGLAHELICTLPQEHPLVRRYAWSALGYLPQDALWTEYARAKALVMPSLVETIGLPLIEAMQSDLPVLVADRPYAREVCGAAALYFDPNDRQSFCDALRRLCSEPALVQTLVIEGRKRVAALQAAHGYRRMIELTLGMRAEGAEHSD
jgi:glycosyltransferase involved in cell wall biosynthesis